MIDYDAEPLTITTTVRPPITECPVCGTVIAVHPAHTNPNDATAAAGRAQGHANETNPNTTGRLELAARYYLEAVLDAQAERFDTHLDAHTPAEIVAAIREARANITTAVAQIDGWQYIGPSDSRALEGTRQALAAVRATLVDDEQPF